MIKADYERAFGQRATLLRIATRCLTTAGFRAVALYRLSSWCRDHRLRPISWGIYRLNAFLCHCTIGIDAKIGPGFAIRHPGITIGTRTQVGANFDIRQGVTLGGSMGRKREGRSQPLIGDSVLIGAGAVVVGPVVVGDRVVIGANAVVVDDVPNDAVVTGVPGRVIRLNGKKIPLIEQHGELSDILRDVLRRLDTLEAIPTPVSDEDKHR